jgi:hypothetical protein
MHASTQPAQLQHRVSPSLRSPPAGAAPGAITAAGALVSPDTWAQASLGKLTTRKRKASRQLTKELEGDSDDDTDGELAF